MANIAVIVWGHELLPQWHTKIYIPEVPKIHVFGKDILRYSKQMSSAIQAVQEHKAKNKQTNKQKTHKATSKPSEVPTALPLKWLTEKPT